MKPVLPEPIRLSRERQEKSAKLAGLRPGWLCPKCAPAGNIVDVTVYISEDPNAEVRDPDTGDVIFRATKTKLRAITLSSDPQPLGSAREATEDGQHKTNPDPTVRHGRDSQGGER